MTADLSLPRGIRDIAPEEYLLHEKVRAAFEGVARDYNFKVMEPASIETLEILRAKSGEAIDKEVYFFKDKAGRDIGLRFDLTVGMTRYFCSNRGIKLPAKLAAFGGMWRYDEPQSGRYRWAHQWDFEIFGAPTVDSDAEIVDASAAVLTRLGIGATFHVGDRRVVEDYVRKRVGVTDQQKVEELMRALDKVDKKTERELQEEYSARGFTKGQLDTLLELGSLSGPPGEVLKKASELSLTATDELAALADMLRARGVDNIEYDMGIVRGIDYYSGIVFEAADRSKPKLGSLLGGGRYDTLPRLFGRPEISATGAAGGVERESMSLGEAAAKTTLVAFVAYAEEALYDEALRVASEFRRKGIPSDLSQRGKSLGKQLQDAGASGAGWAAIVGRRELSQGKVTLRNLTDGTEELLTLSEAAGSME